jgi:hypothetical protein
MVSSRGARNDKRMGWMRNRVGAALVALVACTVCSLPIPGLGVSLAFAEGKTDASSVGSGGAVKSTKVESDEEEALESEDGTEGEGEEEPRKFNDVLMDLLNEFAFDMKAGLLKGIPNTALRRVALSEGLPKSYETYVESLVSERLRRYSTVKVIQCAQCKARRSVIEKGRVIISSPVNNPAELDKIAEVLKVETWTDVAVLYQETSLLLAFNVFDAKTKELLWTKIYNSETLYRRVVETSKVPRESSEDEPSEEKKDEGPKSKYVLQATLGYFLIPNVKKPSNMVGGILRAAEAFSQERSEIGAAVMGVVDPGVFVKNYAGVEGDPSASGEVTRDGKKETIKTFAFGLGIFASYHHNFVKLPIDYDALRYGAHVELGGIVAKGYITFTGRAGPTFRFGRRFVGEVGVMYSAPTTLTLTDDLTYKTKGGVGADVTFGIIL